MTKNVFLLLILGVFIGKIGNAQDNIKDLEIGGYLTNMQSQLYSDVDKEWISDNQVHNRLNVFWYPKSNITTSVQFRNRLIYGSLIQMSNRFPTAFDYSNMILQDPGLVDMSFDVSSGNSYLLTSKIDRAYLQFSPGKFEITAGRQRINWGQNFVWNPNDVFNAYSFFDIDYPERPGSDALRVKYYSSFTSSMEVAAKLNRDEQLTAAAMYKFNKWEYDFQILGGIFEEDDWFIGAGWSGAISDAAFRGEISYFRPKEHFSDTSGTFVTSVGLDYMFDNSLFIKFEGLYNDINESANAGNVMFSSSQQFSAKRLLFTEYAAFAQASYPVTPLFEAKAAAMYYPEINGYFFSPSLNYSITENMYIDAIYQYFYDVGNLSVTGFGNSDSKGFNMAFLRLKWNF